MAPRASIELELYDEDSEVVKSLHRVVVPWGILKKAIRMGKVLDKPGDEMTEDDINQVSDLVVEIFGEDKVTRAELDKYADIGDMMAVLMNIISRARGIIPNAPPVAQS